MGEHDLISREAALKALTKVCNFNGDFLKKGLGTLVRPWEVAHLLREIPAVDAEPVRHGRWRLANKELSECSACGMIRNIRTQFAWTYCPNCGAKMDLEVQDD